MNPKVEIREVAFDSSEYRASLELRAVVLRHPLGILLSAGDTQGEAEQRHLIATLEGRLVGCLILVPKTNGIFKMRQVAVALGAQSAGIGKALVAAAEALVRNEGGHEIELHARLTAVPFYERQSYTREGAPFLEVGIPHYRMRKSLR